MLVASGNRAPLEYSLVSVSMSVNGYIYVCQVVAISWYRWNCSPPPNLIPCLYSVCSEIPRHVAILLQFIPVSQSCSIISFVIMYAGLPPVLAKNANGGFSFGRILDAFKISDVFLNNIAKDTNTSNRSPNREEFSDCDMAISILVCSLSFVAQISNPAWCTMHDKLKRFFQQYSLENQSLL